MNINPTDANESAANQLTCFNSATSNLLGNGSCFNTLDSRLENVQSNLNHNVNNVNTGSRINEVPFVNHQTTTTTLKTDQPVRTSQPTHFDFNSLTTGDSGLHKIAKLSKHLAKKTQLDKKRSLNGGQQIPTSTRTLAANNELMESQNLSNSIIEDQLFKANESVCRLFINNDHERRNEEQIHRQLSHLSGEMSKHAMQSQKYPTNHSQSVDNLANKSIGNRLLQFYNSNLSNQAYTNQTYSTIDKADKGRYNSNLSLRSKYQRCVVNIPNLQPVFKSALSSQFERPNQTESDNQFENNFNDNESLASEEIPEPAPPIPPQRKVSLPAELRTANDTAFTSYRNTHQTNQFSFDESNDLKNQTNCLSFNHSTPTINSLNQFRYSIYLNKLKEDEYQKQLEQNRLEQDQLSQSSTNESLVKSFDSASNSPSLRSLSRNSKISSKFDQNNGESIDNEDELIRPSTSNTTRIMINYKK